MSPKPPIDSTFWGRFEWLIATVWVGFVFFTFFAHLYGSWPAFSPIFNTSRFPPAPAAQRLEVWAGFLRTLVVGAWITGILWSLGRRLRKGLSLSLSSPGLRFCFDWVLGLLLMNLFWMGLGLARLWFEPLWMAAFASLTFLLSKDLLQLRKNQASFSQIQIKGIPHPSPTRGHPLAEDQGRQRGTKKGPLFDGGKTRKAIFRSALKKIPYWAVLAPFYFLFLLAHSLLPETFYDSLNYFLGMPAFWLFHHGISDYPTHLLSGYFHGGSLFFMNGLVFAGTEGAKALNAVVLALCAVFAWEWIREVSGFLPGITAGTAVLTFPLLYLNAWAVRVDGLATLTLLLFFYCLEKAGRLFREKGGEDGALAWTLAAGLLAGLALSIKPTAVVGISAALLACLWQNGFSLFRDRKVWLILLGCGILEIGPWLVKNALFAGNAFFPYAASWMGGLPVSAPGYARLLGENRQYLPMDRGLASVLTLPWRLTMPQSGDGQFIGPLFLAFLPILLVRRPSPGPLRFLAKTMVWAFFLGLCLSHMLRFSIPAFVLSLMVLSAVLAAQRTKAWGTLWIASVAACAVLCFGKYLELSARYYDGAGLWSGKETRESYLGRKLLNSYEPLVRWTDGHLPADARILIVGDARGVYYRRPYYANSVFDEPFLAEAARREPDPRGILRRLHELGADYVAVNIPEGLRTSEEYRQYRLLPGQWARLNEFLRRGLEPVFWKDYLAVYRVKDRWGGAPGPYVVNPFSFFCPAAYDFIEDFEARRFARAEKESDELLGLFPKEAYWWEKKALLEKAEGKAAEAFKDFHRADRLGGLTAEGYRNWIALAENQKKAAEARRARRRAENARPASLKD